jgi:N-acetylglucosaminyldiphosphoundecaprenol N-acetyl-beta-D-mannosaminyltransferase
MFVGSLRDAVRAVSERASSGSGGYVVQCDLHLLMSAKRDPRVKRALLDASHVMPDGVPVVWLQHRLGAQRAERIAGPDLFAAVMDETHGSGLRHAFVGSTADVLASLVRSVEERYPGTEIAGAHSPPFGDVDDLGDAAGVVGGLGADIVWVAFGAPKQELWMAQHAARLAPAVLVGVGAAFDLHAGARSRAPRVVQRLGLEWSYRVLHEPRRLAGRYLWTGLEFMQFGAAVLARRGRGA